MFENDLYGYAHEILLSPIAETRPYFSKNGVERILQEHVSRKMDHHRVLWQLVVIETWLQQKREQYSSPRFAY